MILWHGTQDAPRIPELVPAGQSVQIWIGTHPTELGQDVAVSWEVFRAGEPARRSEALRHAGVKKGADVVPANWHHNDTSNGNSHWLAELGPFEAGDAVEYSISGAGPDGPIEERSFQFSAMVPNAKERKLRVDMES